MKAAELKKTDQINQSKEKYRVFKKKNTGRKKIRREAISET